MLKSLFIIAFRNFIKNRVYALINILGLGLGITCCFTQYTILKHEYSFDDFHTNADNIYRIVEHYNGDNGINYGAYLPNPLGYTVEEQLTDINVIPIHGPLNDNFRVDEDKIFAESKIVFANANLLKHFDFPLVAGNDLNALNKPGKVMLTEKIALKYFGNENPIGKFITSSKQMELEVVGVLKNPPINTNIQFDMLISHISLRQLYPDWLANWNAHWESTTYLALKPETSIKSIEAQIQKIAEIHFNEEKADQYSYFLQPLDEVHINDQYASGPHYVAPKEVLWGASLTVLLILLVSILNFINLSTSLATKRSKEIGVRKTLGSQKSHLIGQFLLETLLVVFFAVLLGLSLGQILIRILGDTVSIIPFNTSYDATIIGFSVIMIIVVTLLSGIYPSMVLARFNPVEAIKNQVSLSKGSGSFSLRKVLTVSQFTIANLLLGLTIIAAFQMRYIKSKDLGFDTENILLLHFSDKSVTDISVIQEDLKALHFVQNATRCMGPPQTGYNWNSSYNLLGQPSSDALNTQLKFIDNNYFSTFQLNFVSGGGFNNKLYPDSLQRIVVNEEFVRRLLLTPEEAVGQIVEYNGSYRGTISGVLKDYHIDKLNMAIRPIVLAYQPRNMNDINLKLTSNDYAAYLPVLEKKFKEYDPEGIFEPTFLSDDITNLYEYESLAHNAFQSFAVLAMIIGLMGLYGLVSFMIEKNRKSISIKKVFGASSNIILIWTSKEYLKLVCISFIIAAPISYWVGQYWLDTFYYSIKISWFHYLINFILIMCISMLAVGYKSYTAAIANPTNALVVE